MRCSCHVFFLSYCGHECHGILPPVSMLMYAARCTKNKEKTASVIAQGKGRGGRVRRGKPLQSCILQKYAVGGRAAGRAGSSSERGKGQRRNVGARGPAMQMTAPSIQRRRAEKGSSGASLKLEGGGLQRGCTPVSSRQRDRAAVRNSSPA